MTQLNDSIYSSHIDDTVDRIRKPYGGAKIVLLTSSVTIATMYAMGLCLRVYVFVIVKIAMSSHTHPLSREIVNLQTSTKVSSLPVRFCRLVTRCQRLRFVLRFWRYIN